MTRGRGGYWNRAGRRSGGDRPVVLDVPRYDGFLMQCDQCGNDRLPLFVTSGCAGCREGVALLNRANSEFGAAEIARRVAEMQNANNQIPAPSGAEEKP